MSETISPNLVGMLTEHLQKTGSVQAEIGAYLAKVASFQDRSHQAKEASFGIAKGRAEQLAVKLAQTRLPTGHNVLETAEAVKTASLMLSDHQNALNMLDLVVDHFVAASKVADAKAAAYDIGRPGKAASQQQLSAEDELCRDVRKTGP